MYGDNDIGFIQHLLNEDDQLYSSDSDQLSSFSRPSSCQVQLDRSTYHSVRQEVMEVKNLLRMVRSLLEKVRSILIYKKSL